MSQRLGKAPESHKNISSGTDHVLSVDRQREIKTDTLTSVCINSFLHAVVLPPTDIPTHILIPFLICAGLKQAAHGHL